MAMAPRKMAICVNGTLTHMRSGHVDMLMTFDRNHPNFMAGNPLKLQQAYTNSIFFSVFSWRNEERADALSHPGG